MSRGTIAALFATALVALAVVIVAALGISNDNASNAQPSAVVDAPKSAFAGATLPPGVRAPDFSLKDENGKRVTMKEYRGRPVVVTFMYSHCHDTCPVHDEPVNPTVGHVQLADLDDRTLPGLD